MGRRPFLRLAASPLAAIPVRMLAGAQLIPRGASLSPEDDALLEDLSRRSFRYFWENADPATGQVRDRARTDGGEHFSGHVASIAATGFGLAGLCIAAERGWVPREQAMERVRRTVGFLVDGLPHERGWFYHFVNLRTGAREWRSELSSIDTALLVAGVLTARGCFSGDREIVRQASAVYERIDFPWMLNGHPHLLSMGWKPEDGFLEARWKHYCELMVLSLLGIGSPSKPLPPASWWAWERPIMHYGDHRYISHADPLFVHQFSHAWIDFRGWHEPARRAAPAAAAPLPQGIDWWQNSVTATRAHKQFCLDLSREFPGYADHVWGITASDSRKGYVAWGGPPRHPAIDGSVVPCAAGGSLMFAPDICVPAMRTLRDRFGERIYGRYGFADAFHPTDGWTNADVIGIDVGITLLSAENLRTGNVWRWFMANEEISKAMRAAGLERRRPVDGDQAIDRASRRAPTTARGSTMNRSAYPDGAPVAASAGPIR